MPMLIDSAGRSRFARRNVHNLVTRSFRPLVGSQLTVRGKGSANDLASVSTKADASLPQTPAPLKATANHVRSWSDSEMIMNVVAGTLSVFFAVFTIELQLALFATNSTTITITFMIVAAVIVVLNLLHDKAIRAIATRFDFVNLYWYGRAMAVANACAILSFFILFFFMFSVLAVGVPITWEVGAVFISSGVFYLIALPIMLYTKPFSSQGEAYLCLTQALQPDIKDPSSWLARGFRAFAGRLEELHIRVSPRAIIFAINMKALKGEHFEDIVRNMATGIMETSRLDQQGSVNLYEIVKNLNREAASAHADGVWMVPSHREMIFKGWDFLVRSAKVIGFLLVIGLIVWTYVQTGKMPLITP